MVASIYIQSYLDHLKEWYDNQFVTFDNFNDKGKNAYYVPKNQAEHMVDFFAREALANMGQNPLVTKAQGEPFVFLGWNRSVENALAGTRNHVMHRTIPAGHRLIPEDLRADDRNSRQTKIFREVQFDLSIFMLTNQGNIAEDLEEIYYAIIQPKSEYTVDMGSLFILDYPGEISANTQHSGGISSNPMLTTGNLWAFHYQAKVTGPAVEFNEKQMQAAKSISVALYNMATNPYTHLDTITVEK